MVAELLNDAHEKVGALLDRTDVYGLDPHTLSIHDKLVNINIVLEHLAQREHIPPAELRKYQDRLKSIEKSSKGTYQSS